MPVPSDLDFVDGDVDAVAPAAGRNKLYSKGGAWYGRTSSGVAALAGITSVAGSAGPVISTAQLVTALDSSFLTPDEGNAAYDAAGAAGAAQAFAIQRANHTGTQTAATVSDFNAAAVSANASALSTNSTNDRARANHTGTQLASTVSDFNAAALAAAPAVTLAAVGAVPNVNGASLSGQALTLQPANGTNPGLMSAARFASLANADKVQANVLDFGADPTGAASSEAAISAAVTFLGAAGGVVYFPPGVYLTTSSPYILSAAQITLRGASPGSTALRTANTTGDQIRLTGYGSSVEDIAIQGPGTGTTSNKTAGIGLDIQSTEGHARNIEFAFQFECLSLTGHLVDASDIVARYFNRTGIIVNHNSDHRITTALMNNNAATLPTLAGIDVRVTASLVLEQLNIINSNFALNVSPTTGVTVPSVKATDCFFDTSVVGLNMQGAGSVLRSEFTNCWFSTQSTAGIRMDPAGGGQVDGVTFVNCDIYQNLGGTTNGVIAGALVKKWKMVGCSVAGWTNGINLTPGANHFPTIIANTIGAVAAFAANGTGIVVGAGTYNGLVISTNDVVDNTAALTLGAVTVADFKKFRITDNAGINPRGTVTPPIAAPVSATTYTNNTGFRCHVSHKGATQTAVSINGVALTTVGAHLANQVSTTMLDPGGTIAITGTTLVWGWVGC